MKTNMILVATFCLTAVFSTPGPCEGQETKSLTEKLLAESPTELVNAATKFGDPRRGAIAFHQRP